MMITRDHNFPWPVEFWTKPRQICSEHMPKSQIIMHHMQRHSKPTDCWHTCCQADYISCQLAMVFMRQIQHVRELLHFICVAVVANELDSLLDSPFVLPPVAHKRPRLASVTCRDSGLLRLFLITRQFGTSSATSTSASKFFHSLTSEMFMFANDWDQLINMTELT